MDSEKKYNEAVKELGNFLALLKRNGVANDDGIIETNLVRIFPELRPSWKPSEEQMEALEYVIRDYREDSCNATANYLQEILDHLKNM